MIIIISILLVKLSLVTWVTLSDFAQGIYSGLLCLIKKMTKTKRSINARAPINIS